MKKLLLILAVAIFGLSSQTQAQAPYQTALGVRLGDPSGITLQQYISGSSAIEGILGLGSYWFTLTGLYEYHQKFDTPGLGWYIGFGGHIGSFTNNVNYYHDGIYYTSGFLFGIDGILGLEYTFQEAPINLSLDWKPAIELTPFTGFIPGEFGLSIRYTFGRHFR
ncbi:MAG TPA: hypothetical protein VNE41_02865 [Chitinophagaceae bacterium]|nr:hypothetical protein [Chitinophagaceae bacterium]